MKMSSEKWYGGAGVQHQGGGRGLSLCYSDVAQVHSKRLEAGLASPHPGLKVT